MHLADGYSRARYRAVGLFCLVAVVGLGRARGDTRVTDLRGLSATLSGLPTSPRGERSVRVGDDGVGIRFRAPATARLTSVYTYWRVRGVCQLRLYVEGRDVPLRALANVALPDGAPGWVATRLGASLSAGSTYHLVATCDANSPARLGYVLDADPTARATGAWRLEDVGRGRVRSPQSATPLFALHFDDGTWWGQPYRTRRVMRLCGAQELTLRFVPGSEVVTSGIALALRGADARTAATYSLDAADGSSLLAGTPLQQPETGVDLSPATPLYPVRLTRGRQYALRLRVAASDESCVRLETIATDLALSPALTGLDGIEMTGGDEDDEPVSETRALAAPSVRLLPGHVCGDGRRQGREECDSAADRACPGRCTAACTCGPLRSTQPPRTTTSTTSTTTTRPPTTTTSSSRTTSTASRTTTTTRPRTTRPPTTTTAIAASTTTRAPTTSTTRTTATRAPTTSTSAAATTRSTSTSTSTMVAPARVYRSIYGSGYLGSYDAATIPLWPKRLGVILGGADGEGPLVQQAKQVAAAAGNADARFVFYFSLTSLDRGCGCFDANFYSSFANAHPEWLLRDTSGTLVGTFVSQLGPARQIAIDIGNPAFVDAWADWAFAAMNRYGWDGVFADNVTRGIFYNWSAVPVNPRTAQKYTTTQYRQDLLAALQRLRARFDARSKLFIGNHTGGWEAFDDPLIQQQVTAMHGVALEGCYLTEGGYFSESDWIAQTRYLDFANRHGVLGECNGVGAIGGSASRRTYLLASYLLTKDGLSNLAELNTVGDWWSDLGVDLGAPLGPYVCLDPAAGFAPTSSCPSTGKIYQRDWTRGRVLVNPTAGTTATVPLGAAFLLNGSRVTSVTLGPHSGGVLVRP